MTDHNLIRNLRAGMLEAQAARDSHMETIRLLTASVAKVKQERDAARAEAKKAIQGLEDALTERNLASLEMSRVLYALDQYGAPESDFVLDRMRGWEQKMRAVMVEQAEALGAARAECERLRETLGSGQPRDLPPEIPAGSDPADDDQPDARPE